MLTCSELQDLYELLEGNLLLVAGTLCFIANKCIGRVHLSRELSISEREARNLLEELIRKGIVEDAIEKCVSESFISKLNFKIYSSELPDRVVTMILAVSEDLLHMLERHVVALRDLVVINVGDPTALEVIGYVDKRGRLLLPKVPTNYRRKYVEAIRELTIPSNTIFVFWTKYRRYYSEAALLISLATLCAKYSGVLAMSSH